VVLEPLVVATLLCLVQVHHLALPFVYLADLLAKFGDLVRLKLQALGFRKKVAELLLFVHRIWLRWLINILLLFQSRLFYNNCILYPGVNGFSLLLPGFDLLHEVLEVDWNVLAVYINLFNHALVSFLISNGMDPLLPSHRLLDLLLQDNHFLSYIGVIFLLFVHLQKFTHFQLFVDRDILASFVVPSLNIAFFLDLFRKFNRASNLILNV
jgi:hypothetical protein